MKIALITSGAHFSNYGGGQVYVRNLMDGLRAAQIDCCVVSIARSSNTSTPNLVRDDYRGVTLWQLTVPLASASVKHPLDLQPQMLSALSDLLTQIKPSVVHAHGAKVAAATVCSELGIPCVVTAHHGGLVCPNGTLLHWQGQICDKPVSRQNCLRCALHTVPCGDRWAPVVQVFPEPIGQAVAQTLHRLPNIPYVSPAFKTPAAITRKLVEITVLNTCADRLVAPSAAMANALQRNGVPFEKIRVIPHGIPMPERQPLAAYLGQRPLRLIFVGRISHIKGLHILLQALQGLQPDKVELHIVGGAVTRSEQKYLARLTKCYSADHIYWHGKCSKEQVEQWLAHCDVLVHPTIGLEVFGLNIAEAIAMGRPVLASRCGGAEMQIEHGHNGWVVPANDAVALHQQLATLIDSPVQVSVMASQLSNVNSIEQHVTDLIGLYDEILSSPQAAGA